MESVTLPPDAATLMWSTRAIGYTTPAAVADLIDNSISANASIISIEFFSGENRYISILDNGEGMDSDELCLAMKYGSGNIMAERTETDLGRFGLGMKIASLSQCRKLTVISKKNKKFSAYCWDLDHIIQVSSWDLLKLNADEIYKLPQVDKLLQGEQGTIVLWEKLDKMCAGDDDKDQGFLIKIREIEEHLSRTFHRFLQGEPGIKKIAIYSNGVVIMPNDPFFISKSDMLPQERIPVKYNNIHGEETITYVTITPYILPFSDSLTQEEIDTLGGKDGLIRNQGFYVYRNKRLIVAADWFRVARKTDLTKLCRVKVDMPSCLDELWTIDVKKSMAIPPEIVIKNLRRVVAPIIKAGKRKYRFRAVNETKKDGGIQLWVPKETRNGIIYCINPEYPILQELMGEIHSRNKMKTFLRLLEQNIPVNAIHTDFYDDKKFAFEDMEVALDNIKKNIRDLLSEVEPEKRREAFLQIMTMMPFAEYDLSFEDLGDL